MDKESLYIKSWAEFFGDCFEVIGLGAFKTIFGFIVGQKNKKLYNRFIENRINYFGNATDEEIDTYLKSLATEIKTLKNQSFFTTLKNKFKGKKGINQFLFTTDIYEADDFKQILEKCSTFNNYESFQNGMLELFKDTVEYAMQDAFENLSDKDKVGFSLVISEVRSSEKRLNEKIDQLETIGQIVHNYSEDKAEEKTLRYTHHKCFYCGHTGSHLIWLKNNNISDRKTIFCCACGHSYDVRFDNYTDEERKLLKEVFNEQISKLATKKDIQEQYENFLLNFQKTILNLFEQERQNNMLSLKDLKDKIQEQLDQYIPYIQELTEKVDNQLEKLEKINEFFVCLQEAQKETLETLESVRDGVEQTKIIVEKEYINGKKQETIQSIYNSLLYKIMKKCYERELYIMQSNHIELHFEKNEIRQQFLNDIKNIKNEQINYESVYKYVESENQENSDFFESLENIHGYVKIFGRCWGEENNKSQLQQFISTCHNLYQRYKSEVNIKKNQTEKKESNFESLNTHTSCPICAYEKIENNICSFCNFNLKSDNESQYRSKKFQDKVYETNINNQFWIDNGTLKCVYNPQTIQFIPQGVTRIQCSALQSNKIMKLFLPKTLEFFIIDNSNMKRFLENCIFINFEKNSKIKTIPAHLFELKHNLEIINFPENVCCFEEYAFYQCRQLEEVLQSFFEKKYPLFEKKQVQNIVSQIIEQGKEWSYEKN